MFRVGSVWVDPRLAWRSGARVPSRSRYLADALSLGVNWVQLDATEL